MAQTVNKAAPHTMMCMGSNQYLFCLRFDTNNTSAPDGITPTYNGIAVARADVGDFTITFSGDTIPDDNDFIVGGTSVLGDEPGFDTRLTGYSSGVLSLSMYDEDNTSGIEAVADTTDKTVMVWAVFTRDN